MTKEEAINTLTKIQKLLTIYPKRKKQKEAVNEIDTAISMAIKALNIEPIRCEECKYQDECEEVVLFDVNNEEVMGHRVHWCSYGRSEK